MKILKLILLCSSTILLSNCNTVAQCKFDKTNTFPLCEEDYMKMIDLPNEQSIVVIGITQNRIGVDPKECNNGFLFRKFDYCGNILIDKIYGNWDSLEYRESNNTGLAGLNGTDFSNAGYNIVTDNNVSYFMGQTYSAFKYYHMFLALDSNGEIINQKFYLNDEIEGLIMHLINLNDGRFLALSISGNQRFMHWLDNTGKILKSIVMEDLENGGLYFPAITSDKQLCFTGYKNFTPIGDFNKLAVYKIDTFGQVIWEYLESDSIGCGRELFITDSSIIICALRVNQVQLRNDAIVLLELTNSGNLMSKRTIEVKDYRFLPYNVSMFKDNQNKLFLSACISPMQNNNSAISVIALNDDMKYKWHNYFYVKDYSSYGQQTIESSDSDLVTIGKVRRRSPNEYGSRIIKLAKKDPTNTSISTNDVDLELYPNPAFDFIFLNNENKNSMFYSICNIEGKRIKAGMVEDKIEIQELSSGLYFLVLSSESGTLQKFKIIKQ